MEKFQPSLGFLGNLITLDLYNNNLSGSVPCSIQDCRFLVKIDLSGYKLEGNISAWIGTSHAKLSILILRSNRFSGEIALEMCGLSFLHVLDMADNRFSGSIPTCLDNFTFLSSPEELARLNKPDSFVYKDRSYITTKGIELPYDDANLQIFGIGSIDLSNNHLSGNIPKGLTSLAGLRSLNLSGNHLS